jgi:hypothetical protein
LVTDTDARRLAVRSGFPVAGDPGRITTHRVVSENAEATDRAVVADLRRAAGRYPADSRLASLIHGRLEGNAHFAQLWREGAVAGHREDRKTIHHPDAGQITVDCDVLNDSDTDLKIVIYMGGALHLSRHRGQSPARHPRRERP